MKTKRFHDIVALNIGGPCMVISTNISSWRKILESTDNIIVLVIFHFEYVFISFQVTKNRKRIVTINIYSGINAIYNPLFLLAGGAISDLSELHHCFHRQHLYDYLQRSHYHHFLHYFQDSHHQHYQLKLTVIVFYVEE